MDGEAIASNGEALLATTIAPHVNSFIDVGANKGEWVEIVLPNLKKVGSGLLYEPNSFAYAKLVDRFIHIEGLNIKNMALGENICEKIFYESRKASNLSSLVSKNYADVIEKIVEVTTLDSESQKHGLTKIDFLKIDTEGYDLNVLKGAQGLLSQQNIGVLQFEYNRNWLDAGSTLYNAIKFLESLKYKVFLLKSDGLYQFRYEWYGEYYEYSNFVGISPNFNWLENKLFRGTI
ncbi:MAG: FkbM family methyltransferase [Xenococcaceae cyanobacterium]